MKYSLIYAMILMFSIGCVSISVKKEEVVGDDGRLHAVHTEYKYRRNMGSQNLEGVKFDKLNDGSISFEIGKQSGESQVDSILNNLTELMKSMAKIAATGGVPTP